jgi:hypothetical protein
MADFEPYHIRTEIDPDCRYRIRWVVYDPFAGIFKSPRNYATEREALYAAERFIDRRQLVWQRKMTKTPSRPRDLNQWAKRMVDIATGEASDTPPTPEEQGKRTVAVESGSRGGKTRAEKLSEERRSQIAKAAAKARWRKDRPVPAKKEPA